MRVHITDVRQGDILDEDVFNHYGLHVLSKGTVLGEKEITRLLQHQIDYVKVDRSPRSPEIAPSPEARLIERMQPVFQDAVRLSESLFREANANGFIKEKDVDDSFRPLAAQFRTEQDIVQILLSLHDPGEYTYKHSVQVGMLSYFIAEWLGWSQEEAFRAGKAGFLHDIGKCRIPPEILNKPGKLTAEEFEEIKKHPVYGHEIITSSFPDEVIALGALQHHERVDGSGYPYGLTGADIHPIGKIVAVADVYSAMISTRIYQEAKNLFDVLQELHRLSFTGLDPKVTQTFIRRMLPNFIGKKVDLSNGESGRIVATNATDFFRPLVKVGDRFIDLSKQNDLFIVKVDS